MKVSVEVTPPRYPQLEAALRDRFELFDAVVSPPVGDDGRSVRRSVGITAARYFEWLVKDGSKVAVPSGTTLTQMVENLTPRKLRDLKLYPMSVMELGLKANAAQVVEFFPNALVAAMRAKYGGDVHAFNFQISPVGSNELTEKQKRTILARNGVLDLFDQAMDADTFLVEIGTFKYIDKRAEAILRYYNTDPQKLKQLSRGQINFQAFDNERVLREEFKGLNDLITVPLEHLRQMSKTPGKHVIAVSAGKDNIEATKASLSPHICCYDILITDSSVAEEILASG